MSRIRMAVEIHNLSGHELTLVGSAFEVGSWTDPWEPRARVANGAREEFRAEGDLTVVATTGTEGNVRYAVGGDESRQLYVHWNSPLVESDYGNTFHVWAPGGYDVVHTGGQGHEARLTITLQPSTRHAVAGFAPSTHGLHFGNGWSDLPAMTVGWIWNRLLEHLTGGAARRLGIGTVDESWLPVTSAAQGLCGGMVFTVMDYWAAGVRPPSTRTNPSTESDPLFRHIRDRLRDSFDITGSGHRWLAYSSPHYPNGDEGVIQTAGLARGRSWITYRDEWPRIRADIDAGHLSPVGLIQTDQLAVGDNHQVLAYAYQRDGQRVSLWIYDPNVPDDDHVVLEFDVTDTAGEVHVRRTSHGVPRPGKRIFAIFRMDGYSPVRPPAVRTPVTIAALHTRPGIEGSLALFAADEHGTALSMHWPDDASGSWSAWYPVGEGRFDPSTPITAVTTRTRPEGAVTLFTLRPDGKVWSTFFPSTTSPTAWSGWFALGENTFALGATVTAVRTRDAVDGSVTLFVPGLDGRVWSCFWPAGPTGADWSGWFPIGDAVFPVGAPITAVRSRLGLEGSISLYVTGNDGRVWSTFWPADPTGTDWSGWFALDGGPFPPGAPVAASHTRPGLDGSISLFVSGNDGQAWSTFWPKAPGSLEWSTWFPLGGVLTPGAPVTAVRPRIGVEGSVTLVAVGQDGRVWSCYWPAPSSSDWSGWFALGENTFPLGATVTAVRPRDEPDGSVTLVVVGHDGRTWSCYWPDTAGLWSGWFPLGDAVLSR